MGVVTLLALTIGGAADSPLDRVMPEPVAMRIRMLTLREGMSEPEAVRRLRLKGRACLSFAAGAGLGRTSIYDLGPTRSLRLEFACSPQLIGLADMELKRCSDR